MGRSVRQQKTPAALAIQGHKREKYRVDASNKMFADKAQAFRGNEHFNTRAVKTTDCHDVNARFRGESSQIRRGELPIMKLTSDLFAAFLKCSTKCYLSSCGETGTGNAYASWAQTQAGSYRTAGLKQLRHDFPQDQCLSSPTLDALKTFKCGLALDVVVRTNSLESEIHALEIKITKDEAKPAKYVPILFIFNNKLISDDKLLLAFDALVLSEVLGQEIVYGKVVHGDPRTSHTVNTAVLVRQVRKLAHKATALISGPSPPDLILNRHCGECEFQSRCRQKAIETNDLSLLSNLNEKERKKLNSEGIFTVTQLSHTFRPRRRPKRLREKREKYHHALKALAIRENKIHVVGTPQLTIAGTPVYLDVEGLPDRDFYYLIGLRIRNGDDMVRQSIWANNLEDERKAWTDFLAMLETIEKPVLLHYGSFETIYMKKMTARYGVPPEDSPTATVFKSAINLLSIIFAQIYFPTYSNGLKEIAHHLGDECHIIVDSNRCQIIVDFYLSTKPSFVTSDPPLLS